MCSGESNCSIDIRTDEILLVAKNISLRQSLCITRSKEMSLKGFWLICSLGAIDLTQKRPRIVEHAVNASLDKVEEGRTPHCCSQFLIKQDF